MRELGAAGLVVPAELGGGGLGARELVEHTVATGAAAPSAAVAMTMHHFSVSTLRALLADGHATVWVLLEAIATQNLLMASGFAEGTSDRSIVRPAVRGVRSGDGYRVSGVKRPCSLAHSMDLLSLSIDLDDDPDAYGVAIVPVAGAGITVDRFWNAPVLVHAESEQVTLSDVFVDDALIIRIPREGDGITPTVQDIGFVWFEVLMCAAYLGMLARMVELSAATRANRAIHRSSLAVDHAADALTALADEVDRSVDHSVLRRSLRLRQVIEDLIAREIPVILDNAGGMTAIGGPELLYLSAAVQCLRYHPPSLTRMDSVAYELLAIDRYSHVE
ncbi:acyl-CoA dehydrogenase family protein [Tsukamurella serpentis]